MMLNQPPPAPDQARTQAPLPVQVPPAQPAASVPIDYAALAEQARQTTPIAPAATVDYAALAEQARTAVPAGDLGATFTVNGQPAPKGWLDQAADFVASTLKQVNPVAGLSAAGNAVLHPIDTVKAIGSAQSEQERKAEESFKAGNYVEGMRHALAYLLPLVGPSLLGDAGDQMKAGNYGTGMGIGAGQGLAVVTPALLPKKIGLPAAAKNPNPVERSAVGFMQREGVPVSAGQATGNRFVQGAEALGDQTPVGAITAERFKQTQGAALEATGARLANRVSPAAATPESAGAKAVTGVEKRIADFHDQATKSYDTLRTIEADPKHVQSVQVGTRHVTKTVIDDMTGNPVQKSVPEPVMEAMALPVDLRPVKAALRPVYERLKTAIPVGKRELSPGFNAIEQIVTKMRDFEPASFVDSTALSPIKAIGRGADLPVLRDASQGLAATATKELETAVQKAVAQAGPKATSALMNGRMATVSKYKAADLYQQLSDEPVKVFRQATMAGDAGIDRLRSLAKQAPDAVPDIGRAWLDDAFSMATREGGFGHVDAIYANWKRLGPETRKMLFPTTAAELDDFFMAAKLTGRQVNPSKTALVGSITAQGALLVTNPATGIPFMIAANGVSSLLRSPLAVKALTRGFTVSLSAKGAAASAAGQILKAAEEAGVPVMSQGADRAPASRK